MSGYTPAFNTIFTGTLHGQWPDVGLWLCLLALSDKHGHVDCTPQYIASVTGLAVTAVTECIERFMQPDPHSRTPAQEGRRLELVDPHRPWGWKIINHGKYREKARKQNYDDKRTESGDDAERKRTERDKSRDVPRCPDAARSHTQTHTQEDSRRAASGEPTNPPDSLDKALFVEARKVFGDSIGGKINQAIRAKGKPWVVQMIENCRSKDPEAARAYLMAALKTREQRVGRFKTA